MHVKQLNKPSLIMLRPEIETALAELGERFGLQFKVGSGTFSPRGESAHMKLEISVDDPALKESAEREKWNANCQYFGRDWNAPEGTTGLRPEDFGTVFVTRQGKAKVVGLELKRSKYPIRAEMLDGASKGKVMFFTEQSIPIIRRATDAANVANKNEKPKAGKAA